MGVTHFKITRRGFLRSTAGAAGVLALSHDLLDFKTWVYASAEAPIARVPTFCNGCGNRCAIFAFVKNGRLWKVEGNPEANGNLGVVCPKGHGYLHELYSPYRIRGPLKRVGDKFEPISWEKAYQEIAQKANLILMNDGPQSIFWVNYPQSNNMYALRLMHTLGSPHYFTHGST
jgi:thiosulfate reductase/polysulfide reductase chain A